MFQLSSALIKKGSILFFAILFHALFIHQGIGLNTVLSQVILLGGIFWFHNLQWNRLNPWIVLPWIGSLFAVIFVNSILAIAVNSVLAMLLATLVISESKNLLENLFRGFLRLFPSGAKSTAQMTHKRDAWDWVTFLFFPLLIVFIFFLLYGNSVPNFYSFFTGLLGYFPELSIQSVFLFLLGVLLAHYFFKEAYSHNLNFPWNTEVQERHKSNSLKHLEGGLRTEYQQWSLTLCCLLVLGSLALFFDIRYIWFSSAYLNYDEAQWALRQGTGALIAAILASIFFALYVYRGNLLHYSHKKGLKKLTYAWLLLNAALCISLFIRTLVYIEQFNLAYKRIGVVVFVVCALFGIASLIYRMVNFRNIWFLIRVNLNALCVVFAILACFNWDRLIVRYNLNHPEAYQDYDFLFSRELATVLEADFPDEILNSEIRGSKNFGWLKNTYGTVSYARMIESRILEWESDQLKRNWRSWNWTIYRTNKAIHNRKLK